MARHLAAALPVTLLAAMLLPGSCSCFGPVKETVSDGGPDGGVPADGGGCPGATQRGSGLLTLASGQTRPIAIAVDCNFAYWASGFTGTDAELVRAPIGGGALTTLASAPGIPSGIAVDANYVYWTAGDAVMRVPLGGGENVTLAADVPTPWFLALDSVFVYFTDQGSVDDPMDPGGSVQRVPIDGGTVTILASGNDPYGIAVCGDFVYWTDINVGGLMETPLDGGPTAVLVRSVFGGPLVAYDSSVYFTGGAETASSVSIGSRATVGRNPRCEGGLAVDGTSVYWTAELAGTVVKMPIGGGLVTTLASGQDYPYAIAVDDTSVYWTNEDNGGSNGTVMQLTPK